MWILSAGAIILLAGLAGNPAKTELQGDIPSHLSGEVLIRTLDRENLLVAVDTSNEGRVPDGIADYSFYFASRGLPGKPLSLHLSFANVEHTPGALRVTSPTQGPILVLRIAGLAADTAPADERQAPGRWQIYDDSGVGLSSYRGGEEGSMLRLQGPSGSRPRISVILPQEPEGGCDAGGFRASSCSVSECSGTTASCSVSCAAPAYACCSCSAKGARCSCPRS